MGVVECLNHHLVEPYNVLYEKEGEVRLSLYNWFNSLVHLRVKSVYQSLSFPRMRLG